MCGIFGFVSERPAPAGLVVEGLRRLEYRGYDSWGLAAVDSAGLLHAVRHVGKISRSTDDDLGPLSQYVHCVIGHTRWATHGKPDETNAHPHLSQDGRIAVVHNGIIENHRELRALLSGEGYVFRSQTDTEVIAHLLQRELGRCASFHEALSRTLLELRGTFGLAIVDAAQPRRLFAVRMGSPLVIGIDAERRLLASDANALSPYTRQMIFLDDGEWAELAPGDVATYDFHREVTAKVVQEVDLELAGAELGEFDHYMLKEIYEQPRVIRDVLSGRLLHGDVAIRLAGLEGLGGPKEPARIKILACGSSWHAGLIGRHYLEELAHIPTEVEYASEFRYRNSVIEPGTMVIAISQSGETADTLAALRESIRRGAMPFGIVNVVGSTIARECGRGVYLHAGPEFGVAATKSFTNQLVVLLLLAISFGRKRGMSIRQGIELLNAIERLPDQAAAVLETDRHVRAIAEQYVHADNILYIGRCLEYPIALEGALKLKEVSYIHAEGLPAAELKHGPIALVTPEMPIVAIATQSYILDKVASNLQEIQARGGRILSIVSEENDTFANLSDHVVAVPRAHDLLSPILAVIPTQLLAYHLAALRGCDVDQPRNLAKSVTVE